MTRVIGTWRNAYRTAIAEQDRRCRSFALAAAYAYRHGHESSWFTSGLVKRAAGAAHTRMLLARRAHARGIQL
jgi:arylamine N-acetyltransferase